MPPAWVDFSWELVRDERDNVKQISVIIIDFGDAASSPTLKVRFIEEDAVEDNVDIISVVVGVLVVVGRGHGLSPLVLYCIVLYCIAVAAFFASSLPGEIRAR